MILIALISSTDGRYAVCRFVYEFGNGMVMVFPIYFTPLAPGKSRAFFKAVLKNAPGKPSLKQRLMGRLPAGISHASAAAMDDQDAIMLHGQVCSHLA